MSAYYSDDSIELYHGKNVDILPGLAAGSVDCVVTSPPYFGLRDYGVDGQYGAEATPAEFVENLRATFAEVWRVLADDGTLWLNLGDSYAGSWGAQGKSPQGLHSKVLAARAYNRKTTRTGSRREGMPAAKNLVGMPWRTAFALQDDGWILRNSIIWHKVTAMPHPVKDRLSGRHENIFLFSKSRRYYFNLDAIREPLKHKRPQRARAEHLAREGGLTTEHINAIRSVGITDVGRGAAVQTGTGNNRPEVRELAAEAKRVLGGYYREFMTPEKGKNPGDVWSIPAQPFPDAHFATYPPEVPRRCILAGCKPGGTVLDPFHGSGTTGMVARQHRRPYVGIELSAEYLDLSLRTRLSPASVNRLV